MFCVLLHLFQELLFKVLKTLLSKGLLFGKYLFHLVLGFMSFVLLQLLDFLLQFVLFIGELCNMAG